MARSPKPKRPRTKQQPVEPHFLQDGPSYADSDLVELTVRPRENLPNDKASLDIGLVVGRTWIRGRGSYDYEIRLKSCKVVLETPSGVNVRDKHEHFLAEAEFQAQGARETEIERGSAVRASAKGGVAIKNLAVEVNAEVAGSADTQTRNKDIAKFEAKVKPRIPLIQEAPRGWTIGGPEWGDVRYGDGLLSGKYFNETNYEKPSVIVAFDRHAGDVKIATRVEIRINDIVVQATSRGQAPRINVDQAAVSAINAMKAAIIGRIAAKDLRAEFECGAPGDDKPIVLAYGSITAVRGDPDEGQKD